jgi:hypothetical protein
MTRLVLFPTLLFLALPTARAQITVSGKVVTADGDQLPAKVAIQRSCGGAPRTAGFTDRKGQFSFRWNETAGIIGDDASQSGAPSGPRGIPGTGIGQDSTAQARRGGKWRTSDDDWLRTPRGRTWLSFRGDSSRWSTSVLRKTTM